MSYTIHELVRTKVLNEKYYEVLFKRGTLKTPPGSQITLLSGEQYLVASGVLEPWVRLIVAEDRTPRSTWGKSLKISTCKSLFWHENPARIPCQEDLLDDKNPGFIVSGENIAIPLSYVSTFPDRKVDIIYLEKHPIHLDWLKVRTNLSREMKDMGQLDVKKNYYMFEDNKGVILHG